jgi:hypothetical protein
MHQGRKKHGDIFPGKRGPIFDCIHDEDLEE